MVVLEAYEYGPHDMRVIYCRRVLLDDRICNLKLEWRPALDINLFVIGYRVCKLIVDVVVVGCDERSKKRVKTGGIGIYLIFIAFK
jgi:hypothetical protein